jgi:hypothetical protein
MQGKVDISAKIQKGNANKSRSMAFGSQDVVNMLLENIF